MGLSFNGQVFDGLYTPIYKGDKIDCGLNYDPVSNTTDLTAPKTIFELAAPRYYYTDTDFLRYIGFAPLVDSIMGTTRNVQALIRSRDNYDSYSYKNSRIFGVWYLLLQTQINHSLSTSGLKDLYTEITSNSDSGYIIPQSKLKQLTFYDNHHNVVQDVTDSTISLYKDVASCSILDKSNNKEYPIEAYIRKGISYDIYIGSYHIVVYSNISAEHSYFYTRNSNEDSSSLSHAFWETGNWTFLMEKDNTSDTSWIPTAALTKLGYSFSPDIDGCGLDIQLGFGSFSDNAILLAYGENNFQGHTITTSELSGAKTTWFNADPNIYTKIGKLPDDTKAVLPKGVDMNNVGAGSDKTNDPIFTGTNLKELASATPDKLLFPLGTYYFDPRFIGADYGNVPAADGAKPISITAYSLDGITIMQEIVFRHSNIVIFKRIGYQTGLGKVTWLAWSSRKWS